MVLTATSTGCCKKVAAHRLATNCQQTLLKHEKYFMFPQSLNEHYLLQKAHPGRRACRLYGGVDGTRTRDPRRDRPVF
jgi:hypothetical protein